MAGGFNNVPPLHEQLIDNIVGGNIGGILSTRPQAKYASGARTILRVNDEIVGFAFNISWNISTAYREITVIDNPLPEELAPQRIRVDGSISALHIPGISAGTQLWQADTLSFLFHQYITIEVRDSATDTLLFYAPKAAITSRREDIKVDSLAQVQLSFIAIGFRDEKDPHFPEHVDTLSKPKETLEATGDKTTYEHFSIDPSSSSKSLGDAVSDAISNVANAIGF